MFGQYLERISISFALKRLMCSEILEISAESGLHWIFLERS